MTPQERLLFQMGMIINLQPDIKVKNPEKSIKDYLKKFKTK